MGLPSTQTAGFVELDKRFSDDILKIELSDPEHSHLSVVDVPGLFHSMSDAVEEQFRVPNEYLDRSHEVPNHRGQERHPRLDSKIHH